MNILLKLVNKFYKILDSWRKDLKINKISVNSYGNLKNKHIDLENINIIYGKNESGKSTLLNFVKNVFYGISKNKNGNSISDYDKYYPWDAQGFSGKIKYELDNKDVFEAYRDFNRKEVQIYNEQMMDISNQFRVDKKVGNQFFQEQLGIDENTFTSTAFIMQRQVKIDNNTQGNLIQKVANIADSGEENVSFTKILSDLNAMLLKEVGSNNSKDRPINITKEIISKYSMEIDDISSIKENKFLLEQKISELKKSINNKKVEKEILNKLKLIYENNRIEEEKLKLKCNIFEENKDKIKQLDNNKDNLLQNLEKVNTLTEKVNTVNKGNKILNYLFIIFSVIVNIFSMVFLKNSILRTFLFLLIPISLIGLIIKIKNENQKERNDRERVSSENTEIKRQMTVLDTQIEMLEKSNEELEKEIFEIKRNIAEYTNEQKQNIIKNNIEFKGYILQISELDIELKIDNIVKSINNTELELHKLEIDRDKIIPELDRLINLEEKLEIEKQNLKKLENRAVEINIAKEVLEEAYLEMKKNVVPRFNENLSSSISKVSNGKYRNVSVQEGVIVENIDGKYISAENLSIGTVEQIYLLLRLSVINEIAKEKLPIFLDEAFAYYDDDRLKSALQFLTNCGHQIIIFTCTNREKEMLDSIGVKYKFVPMD